MHHIQASWDCRALWLSNRIVNLSIPPDSKAEVHLWEYMHWHFASRFSGRRTDLSIAVAYIELVETSQIYPEIKLHTISRVIWLVCILQKAGTLRTYDFNNCGHEAIQDCMAFIGTLLATSLLALQWSLHFSQALQAQSKSCHVQLRQSRQRVQMTWQSMQPSKMSIVMCYCPIVLN